MRFVHFESVRHHMVFIKNSKEKKTTAIVNNGDKVEEYDCSFFACDNPICSCGSLSIEFSPAHNKNFMGDQLTLHTIDLDLIERKLDVKERRKISKEDNTFADLIFSQLGEDDFNFLQRRHFAYKNTITENAGLENIEAYFDYYEVEKNGLMSAYNDVLPYGDQIQITMDEKECLVLDQYCLLPKCPCTDVTLNVMAIDMAGMSKDELCIVDVNYRQKRWEASEGLSFKVSTKAVKAAIEEQVPDFYQQLLKRHLKLKAIYTHCKKRHLASKESPALTKIGRNESCPCGSGKKYKKCCLNKSN